MTGVTTETTTPTAAARSVAARVQERLLAAGDGDAFGGGFGAGFALDRVAAAARIEAPLLDVPSLDRLVDDVVAEVVGLGPLEPLLRDPAVTEVMVNGPGPVWVERAGSVRQAGLTVDCAAIDRIVERVVAPLGLRADRSSPIV